jgi:hypothetical protein
VIVAVTADGRIVRVEVGDRGGPGVRGLGPGDCDAEGGRGLRLVPELAVRRGLGCPARHIGGVWSVTCIKDYDGGM